MHNHETLVKSLPFSVLELPFLNAEELPIHPAVTLSCHSESVICEVRVVRGQGLIGLLYGVNS